MLFDVRLSLKEQGTGIDTNVDIRLWVHHIEDYYEASNQLLSPVGMKGATPQEAILQYLMQHLHREEVLALPKQEKE